METTTRIRSHTCPFESLTGTSAAFSALAKPNFGIQENKIKKSKEKKINRKLKLNNNKKTKTNKQTNKNSPPKNPTKKTPKGSKIRKPLSTLNQFQISEIVQKVRLKCFIGESLTLSQALLHSSKKKKYLFCLTSSSRSSCPLKLGSCSNTKLLFVHMVFPGLWAEGENCFIPH